MLAGRGGIIVLAATLLGLGGCGSQDDSLVGVWTGAFRDSRGGLGGGSLTFTQQSGAVLQGSWTVFFQTFGAAAKFNNKGSLTGMVEGSSITATMTSQGSCSFALQATRSGRTMAGTYAAVDCAAPQNGSLDLERQ